MLAIELLLTPVVIVTLLGLLVISILYLLLAFYYRKARVIHRLALAGVVLLFKGFIFYLLVSVLVLVRKAFIRLRNPSL